MGRPEGPGCYCAVNNIIHEVIDYKANSYDLVIVDCEPGLEHLSRRTTKDVDLMIAVTDMSKNGILCVERIYELTKELYTDVREFMCVANKVDLNHKDSFEKMVKERKLQIEAWVPYDKELEEFDFVGKPLIELPEDSLALQAVEKLSHKIISLTIGSSD
jgi:CO dehydrogenase maturation factor